MERYLALAYWAGRKEDAHMCAVRASRFLSSLSELSADMTGWRETGRNKKEALENKVYDPENVSELERLFALGFSKREVNHVFWNGGDETLNMRCGLESKISTLGNAIVLYVPHSYNVMLLGALRALVLAFVDAWEPDWMAITSRTKMNEYGTQKPFLDRALYIRSNSGRPPTLLAATEEELGHGTLLFGAM